MACLVLSKVLSLSNASVRRSALFVAVVQILKFRGFSKASIVRACQNIKTSVSFFSRTTELENEIMINNQKKKR